MVEKVYRDGDDTVTVAFGGEQLVEVSWWPTEGHPWDEDGGFCLMDREAVAMYISVGRFKEIAS